MSSIRGFGRIAVVVVAATILTTLSIYATDTATNISQTALTLLSVEERDSGRCPGDMSFIQSPDGGFCIDTYESTPGENCEFNTPGNIHETQRNVDGADCVPESRQEAMPWVHVSHNQAMRLCAKAGKRLPSNEEWFLASLGTPDTNTSWGRSDCNVDNNWEAERLGHTGSGESCVSSGGVYDMIGNVWEWTFETVSDGSFEGRALPEAGYVTGVDQAGVAISTDQNKGSSEYYNDYMWVIDEGVRGVFRGGFWGSETDAGVHALHAEVPPSFSGEAVGFRCVK